MAVRRPLADGPIGPALATPVNHCSNRRVESQRLGVKPFKITLPAITKHLKVLEQAGLIERSRRAVASPPAPRRTVA